MLFDCDKNSSNPNSVPNKIKFYKKNLGLDFDTLKNHPQILCLDCDENSNKRTAVINKIKFYDEVLGIDKSLLCKHLTLLGFDVDLNSDKSTAVINKIKFYTEKLGFTMQQIRSNLQLLGFDIDENSSSSTSVVHKLEEFKKCGVSIDEIKRNTIMLSCPAKSCAIRYKLLYIAFNGDPPKSYYTCFFMQNEMKTYARFRCVIDKNPNAPKISYVTHDEKLFKANYKLSTEDALRKYPFDEDALKYIDDQFIRIKKMVEVKQVL